MGLPQDLLAQAMQLTRVDATRPRQANLRRAISAAYYALFHQLVTDASQRLSPRTPPALSSRIARAFSHSEMKQISRLVSDGHNSAVWFTLLPVPPTQELRLVAYTFVRLQEERHEADYDLTLSYTRTEAIELVLLAETAFGVWKRIRRTDEANVFLTALLLHSRWSK